MTEPARISFIHPERNEAYFCLGKPHGDDYDDHFWPYNAGVPYDYVARVVWIDGPGDRPAESFSVDEINAGGASWLGDRYGARYLKQGATVEEFIQFVTDCGGTAFVVPEFVVPEREA